MVNDKHELVGIISEGDCLKQLSESRYYNMPLEHDNVEQRMITNVETIDGNMDIFDAANKFLQSKRRRFPIVDNGKLIGLISQKDILKAALLLKGENWNNTTKNRFLSIAFLLKRNNLLLKGDSLGRTQNNKL